jgi:hypothetical protein
MTHHDAAHGHPAAEDGPRSPPLAGRLERGGSKRTMAERMSPVDHTGASGASAQAVSAVAQSLKELTRAVERQQAQLDSQGALLKQVAPPAQPPVHSDHCAPAHPPHHSNHRAAVRSLRCILVRAPLV